MIPYVQCVAPAKMEDGTIAEFVVGSNYEIDCAYLLDDKTHISVISPKGSVYIFDIKEDWFNQSFVVCGDLESIWEEV